MVYFYYVYVVVMLVEYFVGGLLQYFFGYCCRVGGEIKDVYCENFGRDVIGLLLVKCVRKEMVVCVCV